MKKIVLLFTLLMLVFSAANAFASYWVARVDSKNGRTDVVIDIAVIATSSKPTEYMFYAEGARKWYISPREAWVIIPQRTANLYVKDEGWVDVNVLMARFFDEIQKERAETMAGLYVNFVTYLASIIDGHTYLLTNLEVYVIGYVDGQPTIFSSKDLTVKTFDFVERQNYYARVGHGDEGLSNVDFLKDYMNRVRTQKQKDGAEDPQQWYNLYNVSETVDHLRCDDAGCAPVEIHSFDPLDLATADYFVARGTWRRVNNPHPPEVSIDPFE